MEWTITTSKRLKILEISLEFQYENDFGPLLMSNSNLFNKNRGKQELLAGQILFSRPLGLVPSKLAIINSAADTCEYVALINEVQGIWCRHQQAFMAYLLHTTITAQHGSVENVQSGRALGLKSKMCFHFCSFRQTKHTAPSDLQPHYSNGVFGNVYLLVLNNRQTLPAPHCRNGSCRSLRAMCGL